MLTIPMIMVRELGEGRVQLRCICRREFTYLPNEGVNVNEKKEAVCPACQSIWDGVASEAPESFSRKHFAVYVGPEKDSPFEFFGVTHAIDLPHVAMILSRELSSLEVSAIVIKQITMEEFEKLSKMVDAHNKVGSMLQILNVLIKKEE